MKLQLPSTLLKQSQTSHVAPAVIATLKHLPVPIRLTIAGPGDRPWPPVIAALVKAGLELTTITLQPVEQAAGHSLLAVVADRSLELRGEALQGTLESAVDALIFGLYTHEQAGELLRKVGFVGAMLSTLQHITTHMLETYDLERALFIMLSGITAGHCLGFNRAALFRYDPQSNSLTGHAAIGPADNEEAHQIWEGIESSGVGVDGMVRNLEQGVPDSRFQQLVRRISIPISQPANELLIALAGTDVTLFDQRRIEEPNLAILGTRGEFVLAPIRAHQRLLGLVFADDYFQPRTIDPLRLQHLKFFIEQTALVWENLALLNRERDLARLDSLTGALNRREFLRKSAELLLDGIPLALLFIDVDDFKSLNDRRGHREGDRILRGLATITRSVLRDSDLLARWGGDEFVVLAGRVEPETASELAQRIGEGVWQRLEVAISIGWAVSTVDGGSVEELLSVADTRMYRVKRQKALDS